MNTKPSLGTLALLALLLSTLIHPLSTRAQGTAFTYQGQLYSGTNPANGKYDFQFALSNAPSGGSQVGGTLAIPGVGVTNGLFTTTLDFGAVYSGQSNWLGISVRSNGVGNYLPLSPLQRLTPTPYAVFAESANATNLVGTVPSANLSNVPLLSGGNTFAGAQTINDSSDNNVLNLIDMRTGSSGSGAQLNLGDDYSGSLESASLGSIGNGGGYTWRTGALELRPVSRVNIYKGSDVTAAANVAFTMIGSSGKIGFGTSTPTENLTIAGVTNYNSGLKLTGTTAAGTGLALENTASGGHKYDLMSSASALTLGGPGSFQVYDETAGLPRLTLSSSGNLGIGTTLPDRPLTITASPTVNSEWLSLQNKAGTTTWHLNNLNGGVNFAQTGVADGRLFLSTNGDGYIGMGTTTPTENLTIAGVTNYNSGLKLTGSTANGTGMALENTSSGGHKYVLVSAGAADTIPTGCFGLADDTALAYRLVVNANGNLGIGTTTPNTEKLVVNGGGDFTAPAADPQDDTGLGISFESYGGRIDSFQRKPLILNPSGNPVGIFTTTPQYQLDVNGEIGCTAINLTSDRNAKEDFQAINPRDVLAKVAALPITEWQYKAEKDRNGASNRHIGPMAQDFTAAFALSQDDKHISVVDEGGVALAAIQGLNAKLEEKEARIQELEKSMAELKASVNRLIGQQAGGAK